MAFVDSASGGGGGFSFSKLFGGGGSISNSTFSNIGGAVSDLFAADAYKAKAQGAEFEKQNYLLAGDLAEQNRNYEETATRIKALQSERSLGLNLGQTAADYAGAGLKESGSALDVLADSAAQGHLTRAIIAEQGYINEAGYLEQAQSYRNMADAAQVAINADNKAAEGAKIGAGIKGAAAVFDIAKTIGSLFL